MTDSLPPAPPSVVVFEADPDNRNMYTLYLESCGARVHASATATDALAHLQEGSTADALIFDAVNLGMTVPAFCHAVGKAGKPPRRLILVTGWLMSPDDHATLARFDVVVHQKPLSLDTLWATVETVVLGKSVDSRDGRNVENS
jgi:CheY-like chemotaxis protein